MPAPWKQKATTAGDGQGYEACPAGSHAAVLVGLIDLGTHTEEFTNQKTGEAKEKDVRKVLLAWEIPGEPVAGQPGTNHILIRDYNVFFSQRAALRKLVEAWRGRVMADDEEFDILQLLGKPCLLTVTHGESSSGRTYAKIDSVSPMPKGMAKPTPKRKPMSWDIDTGDVTELEWVPYLYGEPIKTVIGRSHERRNRSRQADDSSVGPNGVPVDENGEDVF